MIFKPKILAFAGSTRKDSFNKKLVNIAVTAAQEAGAEVLTIDLKEFPLPLYDGDFEEKEGLPDNAKKLKRLFKEHQGLLIASPEYNSSFSGVLKNTIDWVSRPVTHESWLVEFEGKIAAIISASPGGLGGLRGLIQLRSVLNNLQVLVIPDQIAISSAHEAFDQTGNLKNKKDMKAVEKISKKLVLLIQKVCY